MPPRFMFVSRRGTGAPLAPVWPGAWARDSHGGPPPSTWTAWRLVGSNNRELGRSYAVFADLVSCIEALDEFQSRASRLVPVVAPDPGQGTWGWRLDLDGQPVAASGRGYRRQRECLYSLGQFSGALPAAVVSMPNTRADAS